MQMSRRRLVLVWAASISALACRPSLAHKGEDHGKKPGAVKKDQKAWGIAGDAKAARRTIEIGMTDNMRFTPDRIEVRQGETVKFVVRNSGQVMHEFVIGTKKELDEHAALMVKFPNMEHDEPYMAHVGPGKQGEIIWTFNRPGDFDFACLIAGHYQAGMVGKIVVAGPAMASDMTDGEVRKVDMDSAKLTLKHADIKSLDMPAMTMVFVVKDKAMLESVKVGDKVRFKVINDAGKFTITDLQVVR